MRVFTVRVTLTMDDGVVKNFIATMSLEAANLDLAASARLIDMIKFAFEEANGSGKSTT